MKILFLSPATAPDYQCDSLFLGLRSLHGADVVDFPRIPYLYRSYGDLSRLYGKGFTLYGLLPDAEVDRSDIEAKIRAHHFDLIVYGSIQRSHLFLDFVLRHYARHEIAFVDGEDYPVGRYGYANHGLYFKRELTAPIPNVFPIHFAIPASKCNTLPNTPKSQVRAHSDPRDPSTYTFTAESDYYADYARSLFAVTTCKAGWDCLRHLEIMANNCVPLFLDLDKCPPMTCTHLPKAELLEALAMQDRDGTYWDTAEGHSVWLSLHRRIHHKFSTRCTTDALARYVLSVQQGEAQRAVAAEATT